MSIPSLALMTSATSGAASINNVHARHFLCLSRFALHVAPSSTSLRLTNSGPNKCGTFSSGYATALAARAAKTRRMSADLSSAPCGQLKLSCIKRAGWRKGARLCVTARRYSSSYSPCERRGNVVVWYFTLCKVWSEHRSAQLSSAQLSSAQLSSAQHSTAQLSTAQHSTAQHSTAQHSTAQHTSAEHSSAHISRAPCVNICHVSSLSVLHAHSAIEDHEHEKR